MKLDVCWSVSLEAPPAAPPLVVGDVVVVPTQMMLPGPLPVTLRAFALADGAPRWERRIAQAMVGGMVRSPEGCALVGTVATDLLAGEGALLAIDPDGETCWRWAPGVRRVSAPAVAGDVACVTVDAEALVTIDLRSGEEHQRVLLDVSLAVAAPCVYEGVAYVPCRGPHLVAVDLRAGEVRWRFDAAELPGAWFNQTPVVVDDRLFAVTSTGAAVALRCADGDLIWQADVGPLGKPLGAPATDDTRLYVGARDGVHALGLDDAREMWAFPTSRRVRAAPVVCEGVVYAASHDHHLYALDADDGHELGRYEATRRIELPPVLVPWTAALDVVVADRGGALAALARPRPPADYLAQGRWLDAAAAYVLREQLAEAAALLEAHDAPRKAAELWERSGEHARAAAQYQVAGAWHLAAAQWAALDRPLAQAEALERHAHALAARGTPRPALARAWARAAQCFEDAGEATRATVCRHERARCLRLPIVELAVAEESDLVLNSWSRVRFTVRNAGYGPARQLIIRAIDDAFEGQVAQTVQFQTLRAGQSRTELLDVRPLACGDSVPLRLEVTYKDRTNQPHIQERTLYLPVARTGWDTIEGGAMPSRASYERGLAQLRRRLPPEELEDFEVYKFRLLDTYEQEKFGSTPALRAERARAIAELNALALTYLGRSFLDLCMAVDQWLTAQFRARGAGFEPDLDAFRLPGEGNSIEPLTSSGGDGPVEAVAAFADMEVRVLPRRASGYPVDVELRDTDQDLIQTFERGYLPGGLGDWSPSGDPQADGRHLFAALTADRPVLRAWSEARGQAPRRRIRLCIDADAPELHALPWELLHDGDTFVAMGAQTPFSRFLPAARPGERAGDVRPVRVLAAISDPRDLEVYDLPRLDVTLERRHLSQVFDALPSAAFALEVMEPPVTLEALERHLRAGYDVVHYVGHGYVGRGGGTGDRGRLLLQDDTGAVQPVGERRLRTLLSHLDAPPSLMFLAACQTATRATSDAFLGIGPALVRAGVPAVVAMQAQISTVAARKLSTVFYARLAKHGVVDLAINEARATLLTSGCPEATVPVLFMRLKDGTLW